MRASETRAIAREKLAGKWKNAVCATLAFIIIEAIISALLKSFEDNSTLYLIASLISLIITVPMSYGILVTFFKLNDDEDISYVGFLNYGFSNFQKVWRVTLQTILKLLIPLVFIYRINYFINIFNNCNNYWWWKWIFVNIKHNFIYCCISIFYFKILIIFNGIKHFI